MRRPRFALGLLLALVALAGCATPYGLGQAALREARYDEAAGHFAEALARDPDRLDARAGLGIARYKVGALDEADAALRQVVARAPNHAAARLYLGLTDLRKGQTEAAAEQLAALLALAPHPRVAAQLERALALIRAGPLSEPMKDFVAASLEDEALWEEEVREAEQRQRVYVEPVGHLSWPWYPYRSVIP